MNFRDIPHSEIVRCFDYDQETGVLTWKWRSDVAPKINGRFAGKVTGSVDFKGYLNTRIMGVPVAVHRVAWMWVTGEWPDREVDHINQNKGDNRWVNLRLATPHENRGNSGPRKNNTSGYKGVFWQAGKWFAQIRVNDVSKYLGRYSDAQDAAKAYDAAAIEYWGEFAHVNFPESGPA